jgi:hypothetical protein
VNVYVAGTSKRTDLASSVMNTLRSHGHSITLDWTVDIENEGEMSADELAARAAKSVSGVCKAEALVLLITKEMRSVGSMIEIGVALGNDIPVLVAELEDGFNHFFTYHPLVWRAHSITGVVTQLAAMEDRR